jgi:hypothetical protein
MQMDYYIHPLQIPLRKAARQLWRLRPDLSYDEILNHTEIKRILATDGNKYSDDQLSEWIRPDRGLEEEIVYLRNQTHWTLIEACAAWKSLNPFILTQAIIVKNKAFFGYETLFATELLTNFNQLLITAIDASASGGFEVMHKEGQIFVTPENFYNWALTQNITHPLSGRALYFFDELSIHWQSPQSTAKQPSKLDLKLAELHRILDQLKAVDPNIDATSMPGRKGDFKALCQRLNPAMFSVSQSTFDDYLNGICTFCSGARQTDYYQQILAKLLPVC